MIATVRIAPVENWCEYPRESLKKQGTKADAILANFKQTKIITESMQKCDWCEGNAWQMEPNHTNELRRTILDSVPATRPKFVCEHMLEMD